MVLPEEINYFSRFDCSLPIIAMEWSKLSITLSGRIAEQYGGDFVQPIVLWCRDSTNHIDGIIISIYLLMWILSSKSSEFNLEIHEHFDGPN